MTLQTPGGAVNSFYRAVLKQPHALIAGATGSGKSTIINGLIYAALFQPPSECKLVLCDPKMVELARYAPLPHTLRHGQTIPEILDALEEAGAVMDSRFRHMKRDGKRETDEPDIYVIIDEYADLVLNCTKKQLKIVQHIAELGRAAHVHLVVATQAPSRQVITAPIAVNMTCKIALRCDSAIESRQILGVSGAEQLPIYGSALVKMPSKGVRLATGIKYYDDATLDERVEWWTHQHKFTKKFLYTSFLRV
jgi:S-DNA-T family DNA segregation ATPase FtsK/SpoIIIE